MLTHKIPCLCDNTFSVEAPEEINLDEQGEYIDEIMNGTFMNYTCPSCGKKHKPEFPLIVLWP
ncbi:MAG: CpXC domain-containing protein, partial [Treponema sp.]|nr:CpXC domain-containing protein [Treponema sp.]